jgi:hypothetical protein
MAAALEPPSGVKGPQANEKERRNREPESSSHPLCVSNHHVPYIGHLDLDGLHAVAD